MSIDKRIKVFTNLITRVSNQDDGITTDLLSNEFSIDGKYIDASLFFMSYHPEIQFIDFVLSEDGSEHTWTRETNEFNEYNHVISMTASEKNLFNSIVMNQHTNYDSNLGYMTKSIYYLKNELNTISLINTCIQKQLCFLAKYTTKSGKTYDMTVEPLAIVFNEFEGELYLIGQYEGKHQIYRLDRMRQLKKSKNNYSPIKDFDINDYLSRSWGLEDGLPTSVRIRFSNFGNIKDKLSRELASRIQKKIIDYGDYLIYEDEVIGINNFKRWLRGYGAAATVLEPESLRNDMIASALDCLNQYSD